LVDVIDHEGVSFHDLVEIVVGLKFSGVEIIKKMHDLAVHLSGYMEYIIFYVHISCTQIEITSVVCIWAGCRVKIACKSGYCLGYDELFGLCVGLGDEILLGIRSDDAVDDVLNFFLGSVVYGVR